ncbi:MAG: acetolactate synthase [Clostridia bacterium]|nr:acetolactate synthase [Clostridia bacterium]
MIVEQISVFVENKEGRLLEIAQVLAQNNIDISALSLADTEEYGVLRMIVNNPYKAKDVLKTHGVVCKVTDVLAVVMSDKPGGFSQALKQISESGISIKYMYACTSQQSGKAIMILSVSDLQKAEEIVKEGKADMEEPSDIYRIAKKQ